MSGNRKSCERQPCEEDDPPPAATAYQDGNKAVGGSQGSSSHGAVGSSMVESGRSAGWGGGWGGVRCFRVLLPVGGPVHCGVFLWWGACQGFRCSGVGVCVGRLEVPVGLVVDALP